MTTEQKALASIATATDPAALRQLIRNARGKSAAIERAAFRRLVAISAKDAPGTLEHDCWSMIHAVEELRRASGRPVSRMNRMRPKIEREGEVAALEYCALNETEGFREVLDYGAPELTAEAIVLRHEARFSPEARAAARRRLESAGVDVATAIAAGER